MTQTNRISPTLRARTLSLATGALAISLLAAGALTTSARADEEGAEIVASVSGLRSTRGVVRIALYAREGDWLSHEHTVATCVAHVRGDDASCSLGHQAPGTYAIALLHDEDEDGDMDRDFIGLPQEGYGFSGGARPGFGPPSFGDAAFVHGDERTLAAIQARYGI